MVVEPPRPETQYGAPGAVHRHTLELGVQCGQQTDQFDIWLLAQ